MIHASHIPELSQQDAVALVRDETTHPYYSLSVDRANTMRAWYCAREERTSLKKSIIKRSSIESEADYTYRLDNFDLLPFEVKFFHTQQRIYDENNVQRTYPDNYAEYWQAKELHFDDQGTEIDSFYRDRVLYTKEVEGFGAICNDIATKDGKPLSVDSIPVPYSYVVSASELINYSLWYGMLQWAVIRQVKGEDTEYRVFTPKNIYFFSDREANPVRVPHKFGQTPVILLKGAPDPDSRFRIGMPRRFNLTGLYLTASELNYDLKQGSKFFGHPIPAYPEGMIKQIAGAYDNKDKAFDSQKIKDEVGMVLLYPDGEPPTRLFYQADMSGMEHLRKVVFEDLKNLIYELAQVRDKSKVVHNASGRSKQFDSVEEQGLLAQTAMDMEAIERENQAMMARATGQDEREFNTVYSKHHDLSSADETWQHLSEGAQYKVLNLPLFEYLTTEYLRKKSAPGAAQKALKEHIEEYGMPMSAQEAAALKDLIDNQLIANRLRPELSTTN